MNYTQMAGRLQQFFASLVPNKLFIVTVDPTTLMNYI